MEKLSRKKIFGMKIGFTTVELLVYITIITVVTTVLTNFVIDATKTAAAARQAKEVQQNSRTLMTKIMRDIRLADHIDVITAENKIQLTIDGLVTGYYLSNGKIYYYTPTTTEIISSNNVIIKSDISSHVFTESSGTILVSFTAEYFNPLSEDAPIGSGGAYSLTSSFTQRQNVY